jgi:hypothetical protein
MAVDTLVAAELYRHAATAMLSPGAEAGWAALMGDAAAVAGLASALASLVKRTALSITDSVIASEQSSLGGTALEQQPVGLHGRELPTHVAAAVVREAFPAAVPVLAHAVLASIAEGLVCIADAMLRRPCADSDGGVQRISTTGGGTCLQQCKASVMLLTVLVGRSLVVIADAMDAAAAAAGTTPAQLFAR